MSTAKIILNRPCTHEGIAHAVGAELTVLLHDAEYLVARGVANFKPGVQKRAAPNNPAPAESAAAGEPAAAADPAAAEPAPLTAETGATP